MGARGDAAPLEESAGEPRQTLPWPHPHTPPPTPSHPTRSLRDNTYKGAFGDDGWGAKASDILMKVRGKDFRHEKTKKKRGSYRGGLIDMGAVKSIKLGEE